MSSVHAHLTGILAVGLQLQQSLRVPGVSATAAGCPDAFMHLHIW
jgi:hypothetical protein